MIIINDNNEIFCKDNDLIWFLRVQLAEALNLQVHRFGDSNDFCIDKNYSIFLSRNYNHWSTPSIYS